MIEVIIGNAVGATSLPTALPTAVEEVAIRIINDTIPVAVAGVDEAVCRGLDDFLNAYSASSISILISHAREFFFTTSPTNLLFGVCRCSIDRLIV